MKKNNSNNLLQLFRGLLLGVLLCSYSIIAQAEKNTEDAMPDAGHLTLTGSTALSNLMTYWVQAFAEQNPSITVNLVDTGDISGIDALINYRNLSSVIIMAYMLFLLRWMLWTFM